MQRIQGFTKQCVTLAFSCAIYKQNLVRRLEHPKCSSVPQNFKFCIISVLKMLYFSLIHCHLKYCTVSWRIVSGSFLYSLEVLHNNILKPVTFNNFRCHIALLYKSRVFFKENVRNPVWICRDPISLILGTRFSLILGTR